MKNNFLLFGLIFICAGTVFAEIPKSKIKLLKHKDAHIRAETIKELALNREKSAAPYFKEALKDKNAQVRTVAAESLAVIKDTSAVDSIVDALKNEKDESVRLSLLSALGSIGSISALPTLKQIFADENKEISERVYAAASLSNFLKPDIFELFVKGLSDSNKRIRKQSLSSLKKMALRGYKLKEAVAAVSRVLVDDDEDVRTMAEEIHTKLKKYAEIEE